ncbi:MAG TPA: hypothetical protein VK588_15255, partial [Chitinophagaceae bacterium]|nr:hypothetical protein [Chitinophagaceae bacterium]
MTYKAKLLLGLGLIAIAAAVILFLDQKSRNAGKKIVLDGGPCVYDTLVVPARIYKVDFYDSVHVNLYFEIKVKDDP